MIGLLDGKSVIVTGAAGGIGSVSAKLFAEEGARVLLTDIDEDGLASVAKQIANAGGEAVTMTVDITDEDQVAGMVARAVEAFGRLDCALNNVGVGAGGGSVVDLKREDFEKSLTVNVIGTWLCMKYEIPAMIEAGGGTIVNVSSMAGVMGVANGAPYAASKHAVNGLTKSASAEFGRRGIRINAVCPGVVMTPQMQAAASAGANFDKTFPTAVGRSAEPREIAELSAWLLSSRSSYITGLPVVIDGGRTAVNAIPNQA
jgi:NAD(P)-dependent dehydrogenase (short-subunit alcohol dehydrogenase family)